MDDADSKLYERATNGDAASLEALLERYMPQLHAYVHVRLGPAIRARESSMDVVQSVCRELLTARRSFEFQSETRFRAWLFTAALNKLREKHRFHGSALRDARREVAATADILAESFVTPSQDAVAAETARALQEALAQLCEDQREVIMLARVVGLPHKVIAEVTDRSEQATRQLLGRALASLTKHLRSRGVDGL